MPTDSVMETWPGLPFLVVRSRSRPFHYAHIGVSHAGAKAKSSASAARERTVTRFDRDQSSRFIFVDGENGMQPAYSNTSRTFALGA